MLEMEYSSRLLGARSNLILRSEERDECRAIGRQNACTSLASFAIRCIKAARCRFGNSGASRAACIRSFVKVRVGDRCLNSRPVRDASGRSLARPLARSTLTSKGVAFECLVHKSMSELRWFARYPVPKPVRLSQSCGVSARESG